MSPRVYKIRDLAILLDVTDQTARAYLQEGLIQGIKIRRQWLIPEAEIERILSEGILDKPAQA
jgi:excisionase family DNA binding protein